MTPAYRRVLKKIRKTSASKANEIEETVKKWKNGTAIGPMIVGNLKSDMRIPDSAMEGILNCIYNNRKLSLEDLEGAFQNECYKHTHKGKRIDLRKVGETIGGAKVAEAFVNDLKKKYSIFDRDRVNRILDSLEGLPGCILHSEDGELDMAPFACWATWSEDLVDKQPFDFAEDPSRLTKILASLGLDHRQLGQKHYLFVYNKSKVKELRFPTIADAGLYPYFVPSDPEDYCGRTRPWNPPDYQRNDDLETYQALEKPESFHRPIKLSELDLPLQTAS